jgi:hypothetical protein
MRTTVAVMLAICLASCERGAVPGTDWGADWDGSTRDSAGATIVENHGTPIWGDSTPWIFTQVSSIGLSADDPRYQFGRIGSTTWLPDGTIAVADQLANNIRFFSVEGSLLSSVGNEGAGPGEFRGVSDVLIGPGDTLLAIDWGNLRAGRITRDGEWHGSFSLAPLDGFYQGWWAENPETGQLVTYLGPMFGRAEPLDRRYAFVVLRDVQGTVLDTIARVAEGAAVTHGNAGEMLIHFGRGVGDFAVCNGTAIVGDQNEYVLQWRRVDGTLMRVVTLDRPLTPITEEDQRILLDAVDRIVRQRGGTPERAARRKRDMRFEKHYSAWKDVVCGPAGTLLVQRPRPLREFSEEELTLRIEAGLDEGDLPAGDWDVFDPSGRYLGVVPLPADPGRNSFRRDADGGWLMLTATEDDIGTPYVAVWRLDGVGPG